MTRLKVDYGGPNEDHPQDDPIKRSRGLKAIFPIISNFIILLVLALVIVFMIFGLNPEGTLLPPPAYRETPYTSETATEWIFTIPESVAVWATSKSNVYVSIYNQTGVKNLSSAPMASSLDDGMFTYPAFGYSGYLAAGDEIILKKAFATDGYGNGSSIQMTYGGEILLTFITWHVFYI